MIRIPVCTQHTLLVSLLLMMLLLISLDTILRLKHINHARCKAENKRQDVRGSDHRMCPTPRMVRQCYTRQIHYHQFKYNEDFCLCYNGSTNILSLSFDLSLSTSLQQNNKIITCFPIICCCCCVVWVV